MSSHADHSGLVDIHRSLGRIEGKQDQILLSIADQRQRTLLLEDKHGNHEKRINTLHSRLNYYTGGLAAVATILVFAKDKISHILFG